MKILIVHGPNLNLLGKRDANTYGAETLDELNDSIKNTFPEHEFEFIQSNREGVLIDRLQEAMDDGTEGIITNLGGYTHTSVALRDALEPVKLPKVEVHISNIHAREEYREKSITGEVMDGIITGFGKHSYLLGVQALQYLAK